MKKHTALIVFIINFLAPHPPTFAAEGKDWKELPGKPNILISEDTISKTKSKGGELQIGIWATWNVADEMIHEGKRIKSVKVRYKIYCDSKYTDSYWDMYNQPDTAGSAINKSPAYLPLHAIEPGSTELAILKEYCKSQWKFWQ